MEPFSDSTNKVSGQTPATRPAKSPRGRKTTLTAEIALRLESAWQLKGTGDTILTEEEIAEQCGVTNSQLRGWLQRNRKVELDPVRHPGVKTSLRDIRTRARSAGKFNYLTKCLRAAQSAERENRHESAFRMYMELLQTIYRKEFRMEDDASSEADMAHFYRQAMAEHDSKYKVVDTKVERGGGDEGQAPGRE